MLAELNLKKEIESEFDRGAREIFKFTRYACAIFS
jgi:hypothetical protein